MASSRTRIQALLACDDALRLQHASCCTVTPLQEVFILKSRYIGLSPCLQSCGFQVRARTLWPSFGQTPDMWRLVMKLLSFHWEGCVLSWCWTTTLSYESLPAAALQESAVPKTRLFQSRSVGIAWAGGIPQGSKSCSAHQEQWHQQKWSQAFFVPMQVSGHVNLKPVVASSPMLIFPTNFGWVWLYKQINCSEGTVFYLPSCSSLYVLEL